MTALTDPADMTPKPQPTNPADWDNLVEQPDNDPDSDCGRAELFAALERCGGIKVGWNMTDRIATAVLWFMPDFSHYVTWVTRSNERLLRHYRLKSREATRLLAGITIYVCGPHPGDHDWQDRCVTPPGESCIYCRRCGLHRHCFIEPAEPSENKLRQDSAGAL